MEALLENLSNHGVTGVIAAILFIQMSRLQNKLLDIIEKNTKAFEQLKSVIDNCQSVHSKKS